MNETKFCPKCQADLPVTAFNFDRARKGGRAYMCRSCFQVYQRDLRSNRDYRRQWLPKRYGLTTEDYDALSNKQNGCCAICGVPAVETRKALHVDHDHATGRVRGLLCFRCNGALGALHDDVSLFFAAIAYLREHT